jgi:hypothetical protein
MSYPKLVTYAMILTFKLFPEYLVSKTCNVCSYLNVRHHVFTQKKETTKMLNGCLCLTASSEDEGKSISRTEYYTVPEVSENLNFRGTVVLWIAAPCGLVGMAGVCIICNCLMPWLTSQSYSSS